MTSYVHNVGPYALTVYGRGVAVAIATKEGTDVGFLQGDDAADLMDSLEHYDDNMTVSLLDDYARFFGKH